MFVVEGRAGKTRILERVANSLPAGDCVVYDKVGIPSGWNGANWIFDTRGASHETSIRWLRTSLDKYVTDEKTLILEVNCTPEELKDYLELENVLSFERYAISVQNNDYEELQEYNKYHKTDI